MTQEELLTIARALGPIVVDLVTEEIGAAVRPLTIKVDAIDARMTGFEQKAGRFVTDKGVWKAGEVYAPGSGVTYDGQYFIAQKESRKPPADGDGEWRLAVRRGKPGRDGRPGRDADEIARAS